MVLLVDPKCLVILSLHAELLHGDVPGYTADLLVFCAGSHYSQIPDSPGPGVCRLRSGVTT